MCRAALNALWSLQIPRPLAPPAVPGAQKSPRSWSVAAGRGLPRGGHAKVWKLEGATHGGGDDYTVAASVSYFREPNSLSGTQVFGMSIDPVKLDILFNYEKPKPVQKVTIKID
jgi:hypothetical protein